MSEPPPHMLTLCMFTAMRRQTRTQVSQLFPQQPTLLSKLVGTQLALSFSQLFSFGADSSQFHPSPTTGCIGCQAPLFSSCEIEVISHMQVVIKVKRAFLLSVTTSTLGPQ